MSESTALYADVGKQSKNVEHAIKTIYIILMAFCLVSYLWVLAIGAGIDNMPWIIWIARIITVPFAIYLEKPWKDKGFRILSIYIILFFLRCFIPNPNNIFMEEVAENVLSALWLFTACYSMGRILDGKQLRAFLLFCASIWTFGMVVCSCLGIYAVWNGNNISSLGKGFFGLEEIENRNRLFIVYLPTISGSMIGISVLICSISFFCVYNKKLKFFFMLSFFPLFLSLALTDSRTAYISVPAGLGVIAFSATFHYYQLKLKNKTKKHHIKLWLFSGVAMLAVFVLSVLLILQITPLYNNVRIRGIIPVAYAEEVEKTAVSVSGFGGSRVLTGRAELWASVIEYIKQKPIVLLIGESKLAPLRGFNHFFAHCHCLYLQVLLESGIPGLLLFLSFIIYTIVHAIKVIRTPSLPLWIRLLPALPISLWVGDIAETFTWLRSSQCPMGAIAIISAGIICAQKTKLCADIKQINEPII